MTPTTTIDTQREQAGIVRALLRQAGEPEMRGRWGDQSGRAGFHVLEIGIQFGDWIDVCYAECGTGSLDERALTRYRTAVGGYFLTAIQPISSFNGLPNLRCYTAPPIRLEGTDGSWPATLRVVLERANQELDTAPDLATAIQAAVAHLGGRWARRVADAALFFVTGDRADAGAADLVLALVQLGTQPAAPPPLFATHSWDDDDPPPDPTLVTAQPPADDPRLARLLPLLPALGDEFRQAQAAEMVMARVEHAHHTAGPVESTAAWQRAAAARQAAYRGLGLALLTVIDQAGAPEGPHAD